MRMEKAGTRFVTVKLLLVCMVFCALPPAARSLSTAAQPEANRQPLSLAVTSQASDQQSVARRVDHYLAKVTPWLDRYGYAAVFVAVMVEGCGIPTPGQTLLIAASLAAAGGRLNLTLLLVVATAAALTGNSIGYLLGRWGGRPLLYRFRVNEQHLQRVENLFRRRGGGLIIVSRFLDGLRQLNGITAGILQMPWLVFTCYNLVGAVLWSFFWGLGPFFLDRHLLALHHFMDRFRPWIAIPGIVCFTLLIIYILRRKGLSATKRS